MEGRVVEDGKAREEGVAEGEEEITFEVERRVGVKEDVKKRDGIEVGADEALGKDVGIRDGEERDDDEFEEGIDDVKVIRSSR